MGRDVYAASAAAREVFDAADSVLGFSLSRLCFEGPEDELVRTENQQPAILTTSIALLRALEERGPVETGLMAGHSLGEYSALVAVGALTFADAVRTVHLRGKFMQEATPVGQGAMAAILGQDPEAVEALCREEAGDQVVVALVGDVIPQVLEVVGRAPRNLAADAVSPLLEPALDACLHDSPVCRDQFLARVAYFVSKSGLNISWW